MAIGDAALLKLIHDLTSDSSDIREDAAGTVTDWLSSFARREARVVAAVLASAAVVERPGDCRESVLHALSELADQGHFGADEVLPIKDIDPSTLDPSEQEYMALFREEYGWADG